jgi:SAM-dependent methyltransferase
VPTSADETAEHPSYVESAAAVGEDGVNVIYTKRLVTGLLTFVPGLGRLAARRTGGTTSARYCYAVWLRHLVKAHESRLSTEPDALAELGPGDSLGTGIAALLTGAREYYAFDVVRYAPNEANIPILEELAALFRARARIPRPDEFPELIPDLDTYEFPSHILTEDRLEKSLRPERVAAMRAQLAGEGRGDEIVLEYVPGWHDSDAVPEGTLDLVFSQAVLEHIDDLESAYRAMSRWLRRGGVLSHAIDFRSHGTAQGWNGHWALGDVSWKLVRGKRPFLLNREPLSTHLALLGRFGLEVAVDVRTTSRPEIQREGLAPRFRGLSDEDFRTSAAFIQAVKVD